MPVTSTSRRVFTLVAVLLALTLVALVLPARSHAAVVTNQREISACR
jgi:type II secretory pathway component PulJ